MCITWVCVLYCSYVQEKCAGAEAELAAKVTELARHKADLEHASMLIEGIACYHVIACVCLMSVSCLARHKADLEHASMLIEGAACYHVIACVSVLDHFACILTQSDAHSLHCIPYICHNHRSTSVTSSTDFTASCGHGRAALC